MSENSKKHNQKKSKNVSKEQRKSQDKDVDQIADKKRPIKEPKMKPTQDAIQDPTRNTNVNVLNITESPDAKYKKKEIQSNWAKYEMPLDTYEDAEEYDVGIDYEQLMQAPASAGGHFQFKHERSWEQQEAPSQYDKYFDISAQELTLALSTIPFYKRNDLELTLFDDSEIRDMDSKAEWYRRKYYNTEPDVTEKLIKCIQSNNSKASAGEAAQCLTNVKYEEDIRLNRDIERTMSPESKLIHEVSKDIEKLACQDSKLENQDKETTSADKKTTVDSPEDLEKWLDYFLDS